MHALSAASIRRFTDASVQDMSSTAWSWSVLIMRFIPLMNSIAAQAIKRVHSFGAQELSNTPWSFATLAMVIEPLFDAISASAIRKCSDFEHQNLSNTAWALARRIVSNQPLMHAIAAAASSKLSEFGAQGIADMSWSFAVLRVVHETFLPSLSASVRPLPHWVESDLEALQRGLQRFVWGLWRLSQPRSASIAVTKCLEAGFVPDWQVLSVLFMDSAQCRHRDVFVGFDLDTFLGDNLRLLRLEGIGGAEARDVTRKEDTKHS